MHSNAPTNTEIKSTDPPKRRNKRSRFTSSSTPNPTPSPVPTLPLPPAAAELRARLPQRKAALSALNKHDQQQERHHQKNQQKQEATNSTINKNENDIKSIQSPAIKRRRTSRFAQAAQLSPTADISQNSIFTEQKQQPQQQKQQLQLQQQQQQQQDSFIPPSFDLTAIPVAPRKTLLINQKVEKKQKLETVLKISQNDFLDTNPESNPYFDPSLRKPPKQSRPLKREFNFIDQGIISAKAQYQRECAVIQARRDEYTSKLTNNNIIKSVTLPVLPPLEEDLSLPSSTGNKIDIPTTEWWDLPFLLRSTTKADSDDKTMADKDKKGEEIQLRVERITHYIHHPLPINSVKPEKEAPILKLMLTKKETKKLRRQRRMESQKEQQEMIAAGLLAPLPRKIKLSNMMRVLTTETSIDPTKVEAEVRQQVEARRLKHEADNEERKKSKEEKREKAKQKRQLDKNSGLYAAVFRISDLSFAPHRFKIDANAKQLEMTGIMLLFQGCNVVVIEGGSKALKKYKTLMLRRIKWQETTKKAQKKKNIENRNEKENPDNSASKRSKDGNNDYDDNNNSDCVLVWEGVISSTSFKSFDIVKMNSEEACRNLFNSYHVEHYWDLSLQGSPLGNEKLGIRKI